MNLNERAKIPGEKKFEIMSDEDLLYAFIANEEALIAADKTQRELVMDRKGDASGISLEEIQAMSHEDKTKLHEDRKKIEDELFERHAELTEDEDPTLLDRFALILKDQQSNRLKKLENLQELMAE